MTHIYERSHYDRFGRNKSKPIRYTVTSSGCWECVSHTTLRGYPQVRRNGKLYRMNRYVFERARGTIPEGAVVMHICDNPMCINPKHLHVGDQIENLDDMRRKGRDDSWGWKKREEARNGI